MCWTWYCFVSSAICILIKEPVQKSYLRAVVSLDYDTYYVIWYAPFEEFKYCSVLDISQKHSERKRSGCIKIAEVFIFCVFTTQGIYHVQMQIGFRMFPQISINILTLNINHAFTICWMISYYNNLISTLNMFWNALLPNSKFSLLLYVLASILPALKRNKKYTFFITLYNYIIEYF